MGILHALTHRWAGDTRIGKAFTTAIIVTALLSGCSKPPKKVPQVEVKSRTSLVGSWQDVGGKGLRLAFRWDKTWEAQGQGALGSLFQTLDLTGLAEPSGLYEYREPKLILMSKHRITGQYAERQFECRFDQDYLTLTSEGGKAIKLRKREVPLSR